LRGILCPLGPGAGEAFPDLPTIAESGFPGFEADQWYGITGPAGIDPAIAGRLNAEINKALASADVKARLEKEGGAAVIAPPKALGGHIAAEIERWRPVVKAANIRLE
jgi:tripartite-type tricarboxylate transporter receptor subunit TctC